MGTCFLNLDVTVSNNLGGSVGMTIGHKNNTERHAHCGRQEPGLLDLERHVDFDRGGRLLLRC